MIINFLRCGRGVYAGHAGEAETGNAGEQPDRGMIALPFKARRCPVLIVGSDVRRVLGSVEPVSATLRDAQEPIRHKRTTPLSRYARGSPPFIPFAS